MWNRAELVLFCAKYAPPAGKKDAPSPTLPEQLIADEEKRRLYSAIARLPVLQRSILLDSVYFGLTDSEIADTHHITRENVRQLRSRAKRRLRAELGEEEPS